MLAHFQRHDGIDSFHFATSLNNAIDLRKRRIPVYRLCIQKPPEERFLFFEFVRGREDLLTMILESPLDLHYLFVRYSQSLHESRVHPPGSGELRANSLLIVLNGAGVVIGSPGTGCADKH